MGKPLRVTIDLVCAVCQAPIELPALVVSAISGEEARTYHISCGWKPIREGQAPVPAAE